MTGAAMKRWLTKRTYPSSEQAATSVEYAFVAVLIAVAIIGSVRLVGEATDENICSPTATFNQTTGAGDC
jgi:Flp pilus assembly pilin Flp